MGRLGPNGHAEFDRGAAQNGCHYPGPPGQRCTTTTIVQSLSLREWIEVTEKRMQLTHQQGDIVRLMLTLPARIKVEVNGKEEEEDGNTNSKIALAMSRERKAKFGPGGVLTPAGKVKKGTGPVAVEVVDAQLERLFKALKPPVHSRMELAQRVDYEIAVMRGWMTKGTG